MSAAALGGAPTPGVAGGRPGAAAPSGMRGGAFALPASTSFRFALLIAAVLASSIVVYEAVYVATPRGAVLAAVLHECLSRAQSQPAQGAIAHARVEGRAYACRSGAERAEGLWVLLGIGVLAVWLGIVLAYDSLYWPPAGRGWPVSFFVVTLVVGSYLLTYLRPRRRRDVSQEIPHPEQVCSPA